MAIILFVDESDYFLNLVKGLDGFDPASMCLELMNISDEEDEEEEALDLTEKHKLIFVSDPIEARNVLANKRSQNREVALAFLNMKENLFYIAEMKQIMPNMLAGIVHRQFAEDERKIATCFRNYGEWSLLNEHISSEEFAQSILNLLFTWKTMRQKVKYQENLNKLLELISSIKNFNYLDFVELKKEILCSMLDYLKSDDAILFKYDEKNDLLSLDTQIGIDLNEDIDEYILESIRSEQIMEFHSFLILPIIPLVDKYVLVVREPKFQPKQVILLQTLLQNMTAALDNGVLYSNALELEKNKRSMTIKVLQKIMSTLTHHINNPLTTIKGYADATQDETDLLRCKKNISVIQESSEFIHAAVTVLSHMDRTMLEKTIDLPIARLQLIDIENELNNQKEIIKEKYKKIRAENG